MCWHRWGSWDVKIQRVRLVTGLLTHREDLTQEYTETWQERRCQKCKKVQRERLAPL